MHSWIEIEKAEFEIGEKEEKSIQSEEVRTCNRIEAKGSGNLKMYEIRWEVEQKDLS